MARHARLRRLAGRAMLAVALTAGCATLPARVHTQGERRWSYALSGEGPVTVVFESGLGDGRGTWRPVFDRVARFARVFAYDRAGTGKSAPTPPPRTPDRIVEELRELLGQLDLPPPYVLVGHSLGGLYVEHFARTHPDEVAGLVLVDARHGAFSRECRGRLPRRRRNVCSVPKPLQWLLPGSSRSELREAERHGPSISDAPGLAGIPTVVISAGHARDGSDFAEVWRNTQRHLAWDSQQRSQIVAERSGHYVHRDEPGLVVGAIRGLVERALPTLDSAERAPLVLPARSRDQRPPAPERGSPTHRGGTWTTSEAGMPGDGRKRVTVPRLQ